MSSMLPGARVRARNPAKGAFKTTNAGRASRATADASSPSNSASAPRHHHVGPEAEGGARPSRAPGLRQPPLAPQGGGASRSRCPRPTMASWLGPTPSSSSTTQVEDALSPVERLLVDKEFLYCVVSSVQVRVTLHLQRRNVHSIETLTTTKHTLSNILPRPLYWWPTKQSIIFVVYHYNATLVRQEHICCQLV